MRHRVHAPTPGEWTGKRRSRGGDPERPRGVPARSQLRRANHARSGTDGNGDVGVIASVSEPFCESCDRVRLTAEGQFRTCLFALEEVDLRAELRAGAGLDAPDLDDRLAAAIEGAVGTKWAGHHIGAVDFVRPDRSMSQIGG